jgi:inorganic pyrophosphatase
MPDPFTANPHYFEFRIEDVSYLEKLPNLIDLKGENVPMVRLWIKKKCIGMVCTPFVVEDTRE